MVLRSTPRSSEHHDGAMIAARLGGHLRSASSSEPFVQRSGCTAGRRGMQANQRSLNRQDKQGLFGRIAEQYETLAAEIERRYGARARSDPSS
jgi:hypothetical protein